LSKGSVSKNVSWSRALALVCALPIAACAAGEAPRSGGAGPSSAGAGGVTTSGAAGSGDVGGAAGAGNAAAGGEMMDAATAGASGGGGTSDATGAPMDAGASSDGVASTDATAPQTGPRIVGYLPNYNGSYASWAKKLSFARMTHLDLAFALATSSNQWNMGASDADVKAIVDAAHAAGVKVLASLGGGGGDQTVLARYNDASSVGPLVDNLDAFLAAHDLDGADIDIESPGNLGKSFSTFVDRVVAKLRPEGKLVTAAVAQYLQDSMADATLHEFDFVNVMIYSSLAQTMKDATYYADTKKVPKNLIVLGAGFFGDGGNSEYTYAQIMKADPMAWSKDIATVQGTTVHYEGMATMKQIADCAKGFGGIMIWELTQDTFDDHSLLKVIQGEL
jgi:chitinase